MPVPTPPAFDNGVGRQHRVLELDALRGVAALAVVLYHLISAYGYEHGHDFPTPSWVRFGAYGVHLFFVISGFVILMTVERTQRPRDFVIARAIRLYPTYWTAVILTSVLIAAGSVPPRTVTGGQVLVNLTMLQFFVKVADVDGAYWTLAQELAFYLLMFLVMWTRMTKRIEAISAVWMGLGAACALAVHQGLIHVHARAQTLLAVRYCHLFVAGMVFYRLRTAGSAWQRHALIGLVAVCELALGSLDGFVVVAVILATFYAATWGRLDFLAVRPLVFLGSVSYALYAIHGTGGRAVLLALRNRGLASLPALALTLAVLVVAAWAITVLIERPIGRYLKSRRWASRRS